MKMWKKTGLISLCLGVMVGLCCISTLENAYAYGEEWQSSPIISVETGNTVDGYSDTVYKFSLQTGSEMTIEFTTDNYGEYYIYDVKDVEASSWPSSLWHEEVSYNDVLGYGFDRSKMYLTKGDYYLEVDCSSNTHHILFDTVEYETIPEPNDTINQAINTVEKTVYHGIFAENDAQDIFKAPDKGLYYLTIENINVDGDGTGRAKGLKYKTCDNYGYNVSPIQTEELLYSEKIVSRIVRISDKDSYFVLTADEQFYSDAIGKYKLVFVKKPAKVSNLKVTSSTAKGIKLKWSAQPDITGYKIYQKQSGKYKLVKTVRGADVNSCTIKDVAKGNGYSFYVKAYTRVDGRNYFGDVSKKVSAIIKPAKVTKVKLKTGGKSVKASWKKTNGTGYQVVMARNVKFNKDKKVYKIKSSKTVSKKVSKLKKGKYYYVKVRAYKSYNGKIKYGPWSEAKRIKCR